MKTDLLEVRALPSGLSLVTVAKWREGEQFRFKMRLASAKTGQSMDFDYSGGYLAFLHLEPLAEEPPTDARTRETRERERANRERSFQQARAWLQSRRQMAPDGSGLQKFGDAMGAAFALSKPQLHGALHSLLMDAQSGEETFPDFCANYGYDEDSRKALDIYLACQKTGADLRRVLGSDYVHCQNALADF